MTTVGKKIGQDILFMRYKQLMNVASISQILNLSEDVIREYLNEDTQKRIKVFKDTAKNSKDYQSRKLEVIKFLKNEQQRDCAEIALMLGLSEVNIYETIGTLGKKNSIKTTLNREEKRKRDEEIVRLNAEEGLTLDAIGKRFGLSKQRISDILKEMGCIPVTGHKIRAMDRDKNKSILTKKSIDTYNKKLKELSMEIRLIKQKHSVYKYHSLRQLTELRCTLMDTYVSNWEYTQPITQYKELLKTLRASVKIFERKGHTDTIEYKLLKTTLKKCDKINAQYDL